MKALIIAALLFSFTAGAENKASINSSKLPEANQWLYALGNWQVTTQYQDEEGNLQTAANKATVNLTVLPDGITFFSEFIIGDSFYSSQMIAYNKERELWINNFVNSTRQRWTTTESKWANGTMTTLIPKGYSGKEKFIQRSIDTPITNGHYTKRVDRSYDLGRTWKKGLFIMDFKRID